MPRKPIPTQPELEDEGVEAPQEEAPKEERQRNDDALTKILTVLGDVNKKVGALAERVEELEKPKPVGEPEKPKDFDDTIPELRLHPRHRAIVDAVLSPEFFAWEDYESTNSTSFLFHVIVPKRYSPVKQSPSGPTVEDVRTKAIKLAEGENGVREWCTKIRANLSRYYSDSGIQSPFKE